MKCLQTENKTSQHISIDHLTKTLTCIGIEPLNTVHITGCDAHLLPLE